MLCRAYAALCGYYCYNGFMRGFLCENPLHPRAQGLPPLTRSWLLRRQSRLKVAITLSIIIWQDSIQIKKISTVAKGLC